MEKTTVKLEPCENCTCPCSEANVNGESKLKRPRSALSADSIKEEKKFICPHCPFFVEFLNEDGYKRHMDIAHVSRNPKFSHTQASARNLNSALESKRLPKAAVAFSKTINLPDSVKCRVCHTGFNTVGDLHLHQMTVGHYPRCRKSCQFCSFSCDSGQELTSHIKSAHPNVFSCIVENCAFISIDDGEKLVEHVENCHNKKAFICRNCFSMFRIREGLILHVKTSSCKTYKEIAEISSDEESCDEESDISSEDEEKVVEKDKPVLNIGRSHYLDWDSILADYDSSKWGEIETEKGPRFECKICPNREQIFRRRMSLIEHLDSHGNFKRFKCMVCQKEFPHLNTLARHVKVEHPSEVTAEKTPITKKFRDLKTLLLADYDSSKWGEVKSGSGKGRVFVCKICQHQKTFGNRSTLLEHLDWHANLKRYKCQHCQEQFGIRQTFLTHEKLHTQDMTPKRVCQACDKTFTSKNKFRFHKRAHEKQNVETISERDIPKRTQYECEFCCRKFVVKSLYLKHLDAHKKEMNLLIMQ